MDGKTPSAMAIENAIAVDRFYAEKVLRGDERALPLELREAQQAMVVEPAVEIIITDERGRYALIPRPKNDSAANKKTYGEEKLYIPGGFQKPNRKGGKFVSPVETAIRMAKAKTGLEVQPISGPIGFYQWTRAKDHPTGNPLSIPMVFKVKGGTAHPDLRWFEPDELPSLDEMTRGNSGKIHRKILQAYQAWRQNPASFIDMNAKDPYEDLPSANDNEA